MAGTFLAEVSKLSSAVLNTLGLGDRDRLILALTQDASIMGVSTTSASGVIAIPGVTAASGVVVTAQESQAAVHVIPGTDQIVVYAAGTGTPVNAKKFAWHVVKI